MDIRSFDSSKLRNAALAREREVSLEVISSSLADNEDRVHCENLIGAVTVPIGVVGPLHMQFHEKTTHRYIPLATTEGALVASVHRGTKATRESGIKTLIERKGTTRGPVFETNGIEQGKQLCVWLSEHFDRLNTCVKSTSNHLSLTEISHRILGNHVYVRFSFDTQDAMGMNMATIATAKLVEYIFEHMQVRCVSLAGNFDLDKKPSWLNFILGRGFSGWAETRIDAKIVESVLKTTPQALVEQVTHKSWGGSMVSGALGYNAHFANIAAAFYIATGQDPAHVVEASHGITSASVEHDGSLYFAVFMPCILLGVVGGGTSLKTQHEALSIIGASHSSELAACLVATVLSGELSLHASLAQGSLAQAHQKLGRSV